MTTRHLHRRRFLTLAAAGAAAAVPAPAMALGGLDSLFAPDADLWPRWQASNPGSGRTVDHTLWARFLGTYLHAGSDGINRIDYARAKAAGRSTLSEYVALLAAVPVDDLARAEQLAFWINLYNALTMQVVVETYPVKTIRDIDISPGLLADGPWDKPLVEVAGDAVTLNDIEHRILRPIWQDNRIHYAVNCASLGCPDLAPRPYTGARLDAMLEAAARAYVNHPRGVRFVAGQLVVSSIYVWFQADFGGDEAGVLRHLRRYAAPALAARLAGYTGDLEDDYDWTLNAP